MPRADSCCGSAGVYNVVQNEISMKILDEKMEYVASVAPEIIATANVGCMLQFARGNRAQGYEGPRRACHRTAGRSLYVEWATQVLVARLHPLFVSPNAHCQAATATILLIGDIPPSLTYQRSLPAASPTILQDLPPVGGR